MLNVQEEIKKIQPLSEDDSIILNDIYLQEPIAQHIAGIEEYTKQIAKKQYKNSSMLEIIQDTIDEEIMELRDKLNDNNQDLKVIKARSEEQIETMIYMVDTFEKIYQYAQKSDDEWLQQVMEIRQMIHQKLMVIDMHIFGDVGDIVSLQLHDIHSVVHMPTQPSEVIVEVIRSGIMYDGNLIRKAGVIVNQ